MSDYPVDVGDVAQIENAAAAEVHGTYCEVLTISPDHEGSAAAVGVRLIPTGRSGYVDPAFLRRVGGPDVLRSVMLQKTGREHWPERMINDGRVERTDIIAAAMLVTRVEAAGGVMGGEPDPAAPPHESGDIDPADAIKPKPIDESQ